MGTKSRSRSYSVYQNRTRYTRSGSVTSSLDSSQTELWTDSVTGVDNPHWRSQVRRGVQAGTHLTATRENYKSAPFAINEVAHYKSSVVYNPSHWGSSFSHGSYRIPLNSWTSGVVPSETVANNLALEHYVRKIRRAQTTFQGGVFLGELSQTVRMLRNPLYALRKGLQDYFTALKKRRKVTGSRNLQQQKRKRILEETYLEYMFGMVPLVNDIDDIAHVLAEKVPEERRTLFGVGRDQSVRYGILAVRPGGSTPGLNVNYKEVKTVTVKYYGMLALSQPTQFAPRRIGLDLSNFVPTAWELLPWSFLVDYFSNIQEIVSAACLAQNDLRWTMKTVIQEVKSTPVGFTPVKVGLSSTYGYSELHIWRPGWAESMSRSIVRSPYSGSLVPSLRFEVPGSNLKWLNILALSRVSRRQLSPYY